MFLTTRSTITLILKPLTLFASKYYKKISLLTSHPLIGVQGGAHMPGKKRQSVQKTLVQVSLLTLFIT